MDKTFTFKNIECSTGEIAKDYESYLLTKHWMQLRKTIYNKRNHKCDRCKKEIVHFQLHHITYKRIGKERMSDIRLLCFDCHELIHLKKDIKREKKRIKIKNQIKEIKRITNDIDNVTKTKIRCGKYYDQKESRKIYPVEIINTK
jgi:hypothetical protein